MSTPPNYHFDLPEELIAQDPPSERGGSRLLLVDSEHGVSGEIPFGGVAQVLRPGDLLVLNQSEVLPARLYAQREETGGVVELLLVRPEESGGWLAMAKPSRRLRPGICLKVLQPAWQEENDPAVLEIVRKRDDGFVVVKGSRDPGEIARELGLMPLPPYLKQELSAEQGLAQDARDRDRYQTVFAAQDSSGAASVAAPTAGLHFTQELLDQLHSQGVKTAHLTLHVGPGTFRPPTDDQIAQRRLHREYFHLPAEVSRAMAETRKNGGRVIAVGTTSLRVLETVARLGLDEAGSETQDYSQSPENPDPVFQGQAQLQDGHWDVQGQTRLFISPPDRISAVDGLLTNFHLPGSSLLMLVASLMGTGIWQDVYRHAVQNHFRFYSYGDCMLILPNLGDSIGD